jgi:hypothetical protein
MVKMTAMKKLISILGIISVILISSCSASRELTSGSEARKQQELIDQALVKSAVESRRFIVKLDRIYLFGGMVDLVPRMNYIIVDGDKAEINTAYMGRQWDIRPIAAIHIRGAAEDYEVVNKVNKGLYEVAMKVDNGSASFNVYLSIGRNGSVSASLNSMRIENARYRGYVVPISTRSNEKSPDGNDTEKQGELI